MANSKRYVWKDNTEPPKNYIWIRLNDSGSYIGTYEYKHGRWEKIKEMDSGSGLEGLYVLLKSDAKIIYANDLLGNQTEIPYSDQVSNATIAQRTADGRLKCAEAVDSDDAVTRADICWNE